MFKTTEVTLFFNKPLFNLEKDIFNVFSGKINAIKNPLRVRFIPYQLSYSQVEDFKHFMYPHNRQAVEGIRVKFKGAFKEENLISVRETIAYMSENYVELEGLNVIKVHVNTATIEDFEYHL